MLDAGLDSYFKKSGTAEEIEWYFRPSDGDSYVYARGAWGGHAWVKIDSKRGFILAQDSDGMVRFSFDGRPHPSSR